EAIAEQRDPDEERDRDESQHDVERRPAGRERDDRQCDQRDDREVPYLLHEVASVGFASCSKCGSPPGAAKRSRDAWISSRASSRENQPWTLTFFCSRSL